MSPHPPITPAQIAGESIAAAEAGAAILHLHARDPESGRPTAGLEDSLSVERGRLATCNAEQVSKLVRILRELGYAPATPAEARSRLKLKGPSQTQF